MANSLDQFDAIIQAKAKQYGLDPALVRSVIMQESGGNHTAVSPKGAMGLMQLMPDTAKNLGVKNPFDPSQNIDAGVRYLKQQVSKYGLTGGVAAYNAGPGNVEKFGGVPPFAETQNYVSKILGSIGGFANDKLFGKPQPSSFSDLINEPFKAFQSLAGTSNQDIPESKLSALYKEFNPKTSLADSPVSDWVNNKNSTPESLLSSFFRSKSVLDQPSFVDKTKEAAFNKASQFFEKNPSAYNAVEEWLGPAATPNEWGQYQNPFKAALDTPSIPPVATRALAPAVLNSLTLGIPSIYEGTTGNKSRVAQGAENFISSNIQGFSTPKSLGITSGLTTPLAPYILAAMTPGMVEDTINSGANAYDAAKKGDVTGATEAGLNTLLGAGMTYLGAKGAYGGIKNNLIGLGERGSISNKPVSVPDSPVPESKNTLNLQLESLAQGKSNAMLVTPGAEVPSVPEGFKSLDTKVGTWIYDPAQVKPFQIKKGVESGTFGEILGYVEPKSAATTQTVSAMQNGVEARSAMVSPENVQAQAEIFKKQFPNAEIKVGGPELAGQVVQNRIVTSAGVGTPPIETPVSSSSSGSKERGFIKTVKESQRSPEELSQGVSGFYDPLSNKVTLEIARSKVNANPISAKDQVLSTKTPSALTNTMGMELIDYYNRKGDFNQSIEIANHLARKGTESGQASQSFAMYDRLGPEGLQKLAAKTIQDVQNNLPKAKQKILEKEAQRMADKAGDPNIENYLDLAAKKLGLPNMSPEFAADIFKKATEAKALPEGSRERAMATAQILKSISEQVPVSIGRKLATFQTIAQLLNPKTIIRNVLGNTAFALGENLKDVVAAPLDKAVSLVTGERTKTLAGGQMKAQAKGFMQGLVQGAEEAWKGVDLKNIADKWEINAVRNNLPQGRTFKGKILGTMERVMNVALRAMDRASYQAAVEKSLAEQKALAKINNPKSTELIKPTDEMIAKAHFEGLYKTFQDESSAAQLFSGIKRSLNLGKDFGAGDVLLKYPKTPGNILARSIDYSPAGFVKSFFELGKAALNKGFDQKAFVDSTSRALVGGGGLTMLGYALSKAGILRNTAPKDGDLRAVEKSVGLNQSQINTTGLLRYIMSGFDKKAAEMRKGDTLVTYDWAMPLSIPVSIGARMEEDMRKEAKSGSLGNMLGTMGSGIEGGLQTLGDQPLIKTFTQLFQGKTLPQSLTEAAKGIPASFTPTVLKQASQLFDNSQRDVKDRNPAKMAVNMALAKTPLAGVLPEKIDPFGRKIESYQGGTNTPFNVFFNPSFKTQYNPSSEAKTVLDIYKSTSDAKVMPMVVEDKYKWNGIPVELNGKEKNAIQKFVGERTVQVLKNVNNTPGFQQLPDTEKVKLISGMLVNIRDMARAKYFADEARYNGKMPIQYLGEMAQKHKLTEDQMRNAGKQIMMFQNVQ